MNNKWQILMNQLEIFGIINQEKLWSPEALQEFEQQNQIVLPEAYKLFLQVFGVGIIATHIKCLTIPVQDVSSSSWELQESKMREIVVIGTWASWKLPWLKFAVSTTNNLKSFQVLIKQAEKVIGFNSAISQKLILETYGIHITTNFDLLYEILGRTLNSEFKERSSTGEYYYEDIFTTDIYKYSLEKFVEANLKMKSFMTNEQISNLWTSGQHKSGQHKKVIQQCLYQVKQLKRLKDLYD